MLYILCHHDVMELIIESAFDEVMDASSGPEVLLLRGSSSSGNFQPAATVSYVEKLVDQSYRYNIICNKTP